MEEKALNIDNTEDKLVEEEIHLGRKDLWVVLKLDHQPSSGWQRKTEAMEIKGTGCLVKVTTQKKNKDGTHSLAEALSFVPNSRIEGEGEKCHLEYSSQVS